MSDWEEDNVPYNPSQEDLKSPRSDRKRAFDSRGSDNRREYSRERRHDNRDRQDHYSRQDNRDNRDRPPRKDQEESDFLINSYDVRLFL